MPSFIYRHVGRYIVSRIDDQKVLDMLMSVFLFKVLIASRFLILFAFTCNLFFVAASIGHAFSLVCLVVFTMFRFLTPKGLLDCFI